MSPKQVNPQKSSTVNALKELISQAKSIAVVDYKGLKVNQATDLRQLVKKTGGQMIVTKNTLFSIATGQKDLQITGPSAFVFSLTDEVSAVKVVADFAKKNLLPTFKLGFLGTKQLTVTEISDLATLPTKEALIAKTVGTLASPLYRLTYSLNWNLVKLVRTLDAVRASQSN